MKFLASLIKRMNDKLFITTFSRSPTATGERLYNALMNENALNQDNWPITNEPGYGETELQVCEFDLKKLNMLMLFVTIMKI